jgi:hypothetical protein
LTVKEFHHQVMEGTREPFTVAKKQTAAEREDGTPAGSSSSSSRKGGEDSSPPKKAMGRGRGNVQPAWMSNPAGATRASLGSGRTGKDVTIDAAAAIIGGGQSKTHAKLDPNSMEGLMEAAKVREERERLVRVEKRKLDELEREVTGTVNGTICAVQIMHH